MLDESNPLEAPQPERLALHRVNDSRLNCSPSADRYNPYQRSLNTHTNGGISRKVSITPLWNKIQGKEIVEILLLHVEHT